MLPSRVACRWKPIPAGRKAKARSVVLGFRDPHLPILARESPVMSRNGLFALLLVRSRNFYMKMELGASLAVIVRLPFCRVGPLKIDLRRFL